MLSTDLKKPTTAGDSKKNKGATIITTRRQLRSVENTNALTRIQLLLRLMGTRRLCGGLVRCGLGRYADSADVDSVVTDSVVAVDAIDDHLVVTVNTDLVVSNLRDPCVYAVCLELDVLTKTFVLFVFCVHFAHLILFPDFLDIRWSQQNALIRRHSNCFPPKNWMNPFRYVLGTRRWLVFAIYCLLGGQEA